MALYPYKGSVMPGWQRKLFYAIILLNIAFVAFQIAVFVHGHDKRSIFNMLYALLLIGYCVLRLSSTKHPRHYLIVDEEGITWHFPFFEAAETYHWSGMNAVEIQPNNLSLYLRNGQQAKINLELGYEPKQIQQIITAVKQQAKDKGVTIRG
ncbi:hypothetical protein [Hydrotalea sp.]|uniref:hypothetical protein n=1 Tax=Hydrotalea sp. TaxID=2881279 RepID=UPI003D117387